MEVHGSGCQHRVDRIAGAPLQPIALQAVFALQVSDAGPDVSASLAALFRLCSIVFWHLRRECQRLRDFDVIRWSGSIWKQFVICHCSLNYRCCRFLLCAERQPRSREGVSKGKP